MADDKGKDKGKGKDKKEASGPVTHDKTYQYLAEITGIVLLVYLLVRVFNGISNAIANRGYVSDSPEVNAFLSGLFYFLAAFVLYFTIFSNILSVLFLMGIIYAVIRNIELDQEMEATIAPPAAVNDGNGKPAVPAAWQRIEDHINSDRENDWRLAVIEADIILGDILDKMNLPGETIGDKLKAVDKSDFTTIEYAWEAHKARNSIAHEGADYKLNQREALRIINLYEQVFREFRYIS